METPDSEINVGESYLITLDVTIDGMLAFKKGEIVAVKDINPDPEIPAFQFVVFSKRMEQDYPLRRSMLTKIPETGAAPLEVSPSCSYCAAALRPENVVCPYCGAPNSTNIKRSALLRKENPPRCAWKGSLFTHDFRYIENGKICINCGKVAELKTVSDRRIYSEALRWYSEALGKRICPCCDAAVESNAKYCTKCGSKISKSALRPIEPPKQRMGVHQYLLMIPEISTELRVPVIREASLELSEKELPLQLEPQDFQEANDLALLQRFAKSKSISNAVQNIHRKWRDPSVKVQLLGDSIKVSEKQLPRLASIFQKCCEIMFLPQIELYFAYAIWWCRRTDTTFCTRLEEWINLASNS